MSLPARQITLLFTLSFLRLGIALAFLAGKVELSARMGYFLEDWLLSEVDLALSEELVVEELAEHARQSDLPVGLEEDF